MLVDSATITSVETHTETGLENAYIFTLEPDGENDITFTLKSNEDCTPGGICTSAGIKLIETPAVLTITGPKPPTVVSKLSVSDATASEEDDSTIDFVVTLAPTSDESVTVDYATADGTATAGADYTAQSGSLTFNAGETSKTIQVSIIDDDFDDDHETITLTLSGATGGQVSDSQATGVISNQEPDPLTARYINMPDEHDGSAAFSYAVEFSHDVQVTPEDMRDHSFTVTNGDVTAASTISGLKYLWEITVQPDSNNDATITLAGHRDCSTAGAICKEEDPRQLSHNLTTTITGPDSTDEGSADDDSSQEESTASQLSVADATASEEDDSTIDFVVTLNPASDESVTVDYATANGSASAGDDYTAASGSLTFNAGETSKTIQVSIIDDSVVDNNETLTITLSNASGADISDGQATGTITDGDTETSPLTAAFQELPSSHDGSAEFAFQVLFSEDVGISYVNMRDDAFTVTDGDVQTAKRVDGRHDLWKITVEPDDNSDVVITLPANRSCTTAGAICTREDTPRQLTNSPSATVPGPTDESSSDSTSDSTEETTTNSQLSVADATASEEDDATIDFVVTLNPAGEANITVDYATSNGTASAGSDYTAQSGTLTFTAGETSKTVTVAIIDDSTEESDETLTLTLSNPSGAEISDDHATGTITDSEPVPLTASFSNMPDSHDGSTEFTFDLTFSEHFPLSYVTLRDHAFTKDAQNEDHIVAAQRKVPGSNQTWTITVKPPNNSTITITLPATTDCTATGAICTDDGRKLSHSTSVSVAGSS